VKTLVPCGIHPLIDQSLIIEKEKKKEY